MYQPNIGCRKNPKMWWVKWGWEWKQNHFGHQTQISACQLINGMDYTDSKVWLNMQSQCMVLTSSWSMIARQNVEASMWGLSPWDIIKGSVWDALEIHRNVIWRNFLLKIVKNTAFKTDDTYGRCISCDLKWMCDCNWWHMLADCEAETI